MHILYIEAQKMSFHHYALLISQKNLPSELECLWFADLIAQALRPVVKKAGFWGSVRTLARGYEIVMGLLLFTPVAFLAWFPFVSEFQTRMLFNQAFSRGLQISRILGGHRKDRTSRHKE
ncbi:hypothetical protein Godav_011361 [Gossypium davidsonii]|uniref:Uncharacterized protein n=1 Tax=Gossypium davidsonii TaxID=34287 RepID=A0A7J8R9L8_GOSDV|nr:hypothetical protein [Gossypium davidsonii]